MIRVPSFFTIFAKSPFRGLEKHMAVSFSCVQKLPEFLNACQDQSWEEASKYHKEICVLESDADQLKRKIRVRLHQDLFLPVSRSDLLALLSVQDNMANQAEDIAGMIYNRRMVFPELIQNDVKELLNQVIETCMQAQRVNAELHDLLEAGFRGVVLDLIEQMIHDLDKSEHRSDELQFLIQKKLFHVEKDYSSLDVVFWYKSIKQIGDLADWAQRVGAKLLILLSR